MYKFYNLFKKLKLLLSKIVRIICKRKLADSPCADWELVPYRFEVDWFVEVKVSGGRRGLAHKDV